MIHRSGTLRPRARVQPPSAIIHTWGGSYSFHAVSNPEGRSLSVYELEARP